MADSSKPVAVGLQTKSLQCKNLHDYLKTLPTPVLDKLYNHPASCLAVYRELPEIARHYVIRILFVEQPVPQAVVASWVTQTYSKEHLEVVQILNELRVWQEAAIPGGLPGWILNPTFKKNLKIALLGGGKPWSKWGPRRPEADSKTRDIPYLDAYAAERWECVLHYMVMGSHGGPNSQGGAPQGGISADAVRILLHAGLMKRDEDEGNACITREGFQFLLMDSASQVWHFMLQYLGAAHMRGQNLVECLTFLLQLSFSTLGKDYSTEGMSEGLLVFLQHLREFGLVYQRKRKAGRFYPTRLALNIASSGGNLVKSDATGIKDESQLGYIIVETNYRVYAYTSSNLQVALVGLFCEMMYRFPNLAVGVLTRESVRQALRSGISANQIIGFLQQHAHPQLHHQAPPLLPPTIVDQIHLWELERDRFRFEEGVLYSQFLSVVDFETLRDHARDLGVLVWHSSAKRTVVVTKAGHEEVRRFWKRHSKGGSGGGAVGGAGSNVTGAL
ncbi:general transcription factor IIH subunit 4 [Ischnura elegans]|uniref:general transcription factor IIH subunit 4 n=1 Tax=Ischnura elegans TaxID=197161 RepID=UPI001ED86DCC|nr:general transcription factor IIH subunit 4 [Ischnura elegans]